MIQAACDLRFENVGSRSSRICDSAAKRHSVDDSAGTAGSDAGVTSPDEALVGRAVLCTPNERCQGRKFVCVGTTARTHSTPLRASCDAPYPLVSFPDKGPSRNNLRGPMENARVERRQFHSMSFGQFGKVQVGKLSARFRGDSLR